jgi:hypothetical protein
MDQGNTLDRRDALESLPGEVLHKYATEKGLVFGGNLSVQEIIGRIISRPPGDIDEALAPVRRVELDKRLADDSAERVRTTTDRVTHLQWVFGAIFGAIALALSVGVGVLWSRMEEARNLGQQLMETHTTYEKLVSNRIVGDYDRIFDDFTLSFLTERQRRELQRYDHVLVSLKGAANNDLFVILRQVNGALLAFGNGLQEDRVQEGLGAASGAWKLLCERTLPNLEKQEHGDFIEKLRYSRWIVLGIVYIRLYEVTREANFLKLAHDALFHPDVESIRSAVACNYRGVAIANERPPVKVGVPFDRETNERIEKSLADERKQYEDALQARSTSAQMAAIYNNFADSFLYEAAWRANQRSPGAEAALSNAKRWINLGLHLADVPSGLYITRAEIECNQVRLTDLQRWTEAQRLVRLEEILEDVRTAIRLGFERFHGFTKEKFLEVYPHYSNLERLDKGGYKEKLFEAAGIRD